MEALLLSNIINYKTTYTVWQSQHQRNEKRIKRLICMNYESSTVNEKSAVEITKVSKHLCQKVKVAYVDFINFSK